MAEAQGTTEATAGWVKPSGPYAVGRTVDEIAASSGAGRAGDAPRRLRLVTHYPADAAGPGARYLAAGEYDAVVAPLLEMLGLPPSTFRTFADCRIASTDEAAALPGQHPLVVLSPGGPSWGTSSTALAEELASIGYVVCSVGRPGLSSGVRYADGSVVTMWPELAAGMAAFGASAFVDESASASVERRHELCVEAATSELATLQDIAAEDARAAADAFRRGEVGREVGLPDVTAPTGLIYAGHSFGGSASVSAAERDLTATGAVNLDGLHFAMDVHDRAARTPVLDVTSAPALGPVGDWSPNCFSLEPHAHAGEDHRILRLSADQTTHLDFMDAALLPPEERAMVSPCLVDGAQITRAVARLIDAFAKAAIAGDQQAMQRIAHETPGFREYDLSAVRAWAGHR